MPIAVLSAQAPNSTFELSPTVIVDFSPSPTPVPDTCWDCEGSTMNAEAARAIYCSPAFLKENPQMLDECFPEKWEWVCFPDGHCEMYRQDLDPLGIFATPLPVPTPEPLPTPEETMVIPTEVVNEP